MNQYVILHTEQPHDYCALHNIWKGAVNTESVYKTGFNEIFSYNDFQTDWLY